MFFSVRVPCTDCPAAAVVGNSLTASRSAFTSASEGEGAAQVSLADRSVPAKGPFSATLTGASAAVIDGLRPCSPVKLAKPMPATASVSTPPTPSCCGRRRRRLRRMIVAGSMFASGAGDSRKRVRSSTSVGMRPSLGKRGTFGKGGSLVVGERYRQLGQPVTEVTLDGAVADAEGLGDVGDLEVFVVAQHQAGPFARGQLHQLAPQVRSEEHTSELQSRPHLVCRLLLEKK